MDITDVNAFSLSSPIDPPDERPFLGGVRRILKRDVILLTIGEASGEVGFATAGAASSEMREYFQSVEHDSTATVIEEIVGPALIADPLETIEDARDRILNLRDLSRDLRWELVSAVDVALHDLLGKLEGVPVFEMLDPDHGRNEDIPLYASAGMYMNPNGYAEQAEVIRDLGFFGYKYRPGGGLDHDRRTLEIIRDVVGEDFEIMIDAHTWWKLGENSYTIEQVVGLIRDYAEHDPFWVEEPVRPNAHDDYGKIVAETDVPIAGGESKRSPDGLRELGDTGAVDFLQADVRHHGGFTGCLQIATYCSERDISFVPHNFGTLLGLVANAHVVAAAPEANLLEYPVFGDGIEAMYPFPLAEDILKTEIQIRNGRLRIPSGPGLGVDVNLEVIEEYPHIEGPWTEFEYESHR